MTWHAFRVEVASNDERDDVLERLERELRRALENRFSAVVVEREFPQPGDVVVPAMPSPKEIVEMGAEGFRAWVDDYMQTHASGGGITFSGTLHEDGTVTQHPPRRGKP